jgi:hypothetical protein
MGALLAVIGIARVFVGEAIAPHAVSAGLLSITIALAVVGVVIYFGIAKIVLTSG